MNIRRYPPSDTLKPFIKTFMIIQSDHGMTNKILPDTSIVLAFRIKGSLTYSKKGIERNLPGAAITGLSKSPRLINYSKKTATLLIKFNEGGAAAFFNEPLHNVFRKILPLEHLLDPYKLKQTEEQLAKAKNNIERISIIEGFLYSELKETRSDDLIQKAIQKIKSSNGNIRVKNLIKNLPISRDPFEKRFRRIAGTSPKQFSSIIRLRNVIDIYSPAQSLSKVAYKAGYFDQSHFIKDFKSFTGKTPRDFFQSSSYW